jgi:hypothetical protein
MQRREFITLLGSAVAWPFAARAQQATMPVIGYLSARLPESDVSFLAAFRQGLNEVGYVDGKNVTLEFRWGAGQYDRLPGLAEDLVRRNVAVIVGVGGPLPAQAAIAATTTIPILFVGGEPIKDGFVASLNHPGLRRYRDWGRGDMGVGMMGRGGMMGPGGGMMMRMLFAMMDSERWTLKECNMTTKIACPFVYANGRKCPGHITHVEAYKADVSWKPDDQGKWRPSISEPRSHYHVFCSEKGNHASSMRSDDSRLKFYLRDLVKLGITLD